MHKTLTRIFWLALILTLVCTFFANTPLTVLAQGGDEEEKEPVIDPTLPIAIVNTANLNLRSGPGVEYAVIGVLRGGDTFNVIGQSPDFIWLLVRDTDFGDGWVRGKFTIFRGEIDEVDVVGGPYGAEVDARFYLHIFQPVYDEPGGDRLGLLPAREEYAVTGRTFDGRWTQLSTAEFGVVWINTSRGSFRGIWFDVPIIFPPYK